MKLGLANMQQAMQVLPRPLSGIFLIAGTNGKGTTAGSLWELTRRVHSSCGLYISPHVFRFSERIQISDRIIGSEELWSYLSDLRKRLGTDLDSCLSFFELTTLLAFDVFLKNNCARSIIEVGLGGRLDATNACNPDICIITGIDYDHQAYLGETLQEIAKEKIAIARAGKPLFWGETSAEKNAILRPILLQEQERIGFELFEQGKHFGILDDQEFFIDFGERKIFPLPEYWQDRPTSLAHHFVLAFAAFYYDRKKISMEESLKEICAAGFPQQELPISFFGRSQWLEIPNHRILLDVCHNPQSVAGFVEFCKKKRLMKIPALITVLGDKDVTAMLEKLREVFEPIIFFAVDDDRNFSVEKLSAWQIPHEKNFADAWNRLFKSSVACREIAVCGSFRAVEAAVEFFDAAPKEGKLPQVLVGKAPLDDPYRVL